MNISLRSFSIYTHSGNHFGGAGSVRNASICNHIRSIDMYQYFQNVWLLTELICTPFHRITFHYPLPLKLPANVAVFPTVTVTLAYINRIFLFGPTVQFVPLLWRFPAL